MEVDGEKVRVSTGPALAAKMVFGLGLRRAWRVIHLMHSTKELPEVDRGRRQFLRQSGALMAVVPLLGLPTFQKGRFLFLGSDTTEWTKYTDEDFGFSLEYPSGWQMECKEKQPVPPVDDEAILKRLVISAWPALVYLDVWQMKGKSFSDWLTWYKETRLVEQMPITANATIAGQQAAVFLQTHQRDLMLAYLSDGDHVYRLMNWMTNESRDLDSYRHMLDTFMLPGMTTATAAELPLIVKSDANRSSQQMPELRVATCCGYYSQYNPFPCCDDGNCTWWCYFKHGYVPFTGDAGTWWGQVPDHSYWRQSSYPPIGGDMAIACWSGSPGHVAHTNYWSGSGDVSITEMFWCSSCPSSRSIPYTTPTQGWIYDILA